jgi:hypothetical protein
VAFDRHVQSTGFAAGESFKVALCPMNHRQQFIGKSQQALTGGRESERPRFTHEQRTTKTILEILQLVRQRRLRQEHAFRRLDEATGIPQRGQGSQMTQFEG